MLEKTCGWWLIWYLLFFCHGGAEGQLQWVVKEKVVAYGQNLILFCPVENCCGEPAGWSVGTKSIILDVKTFSNDPKGKYHETYNKDGFGVVIRNLSEADLNVTYYCVYGFDLSTPKYLLHGDVFKESELQWVVKEKVTAYGQNLILFCPVKNCCSEPTGWSVGPKSIIIDVKRFSNDPKVKYHGTYTKDGFGVVIRNLSEADLNVTYHCVYGFDLSTPKYLLHGDVFKENVPDKEKENDTTATIIVVPIVVIMVAIGFIIGIVYCVYRSRIKKKRQKPPGTDEEIKHLIYSKNQQERPSIHITSTNTDVVEGQSHTITCYISRISVITDITWNKTSATGDKIAIVVGEDGKFSGGTLSDPSLTINNIAKSDEGTYACIAKHCFGTTSSEDSVLTCNELKNIQSMEALNEKLFDAVKDGDTDLIQSCLQKGADVNYKDVDGRTPLHRAAKLGRTEAVDLLLWLGASTSVVNKQGRPPLHTAAEGGRTEVVDLLLKSGASPSVVDNQGRTPLHTAAERNRTEVVDLLLKSGASPSVVDNQGRTPLHRAAEWGKTKVVDLLLKSGASPSVVDKQGKTPYDVAHYSVKELLQKYVDSSADMDHLFPIMGTAEEMKELISKGTFMAYENRVYLAGACHVGKTTLASVLLGEEIPHSYISTNGLIIYFGRNGIDVKDQKMVPLKKGNDSDVFSKVMRGQPHMEQEKHPSEYDTNLPSSGEVMRPPLAAKEKTPHEKQPGNKSEKSLYQRTDKTLVNGGRIEDTHNTARLPKPQPQALAMSKQSYLTIHEDMKQELRKGKYKVNIAPSDLVDFGGQKSFDMTHQLFIQHKGEFILMFNGTFDFCDPLPEYPQRDVTTESILKHWVSSILSYCADDDDILPIILFAATHSDFYSQKDRIDRSKKLTKDLQEMFQNHQQHKRIIFDDIFFINGKDENDTEILRLKTKLVEVAFMQKSWGKRMPMIWVPLDLQLSEMRSHNITLISREDLTVLNRSNKDLALTDTQIEQFLKAQHSFGKILYFDQHGLEKFIIVQPQSLVNILRSFITDEQFWPEDESLRNILRTMINTGEIPKKGLLKLWSQKEFDQHMPSNDLKEFIMQVLVHLDILVEPKQYNQKQKYTGQSYLVPCIVKRKLSFTDVYYKSKDDKMICLSYTLLKSSIPAALSFKLIGAAMNIWPLKVTSEGVCLYHQAAILCIDQSNELHISVKDNKIIIYLINKDAKCFISPNIASTVQECLTLTMKNVLEFYHKSFGKSLSTSEVSNLFEIEVGEWCDTGACYISVPDVKTMLEWRCKNEKTHKFPLFWIFDKTQDTCEERCSGLDTKYLTLCPNDQHLVRLAALVPCGKCNELVTHLGLPNVSWNHILEQYRGYGPKVVNFVALSDWRKLKTKKMKPASFKDLSDALTEVDYNQHVLCQVFNEDVDVFDIDNSALQQIPEDDELKELSRQVGNCAIQLGVELGLSMAIIEQTLFKYQKDIFEQSFDVLQKWKTSCKVKPTIRMLMKAMQASDPRGLKFLKDKYA